MAEHSTLFKAGERVVTRFGSHCLVRSVELDGDNLEWLTVAREGGGSAEWHAADFRPWAEEIHGAWKGPAA